MNGLSTKVGAAAMGAALSTLVWTILAAAVTAVGAWPPETLATVVGATATVLAGGLGYWTRETATVADGSDTVPDPDGYEDPVRLEDVDNGPPALG